MEQYENQCSYKGVKYIKYVTKSIPDGQSKICYKIGIKCDIISEPKSYTRVCTKGYPDDILELFQSLEIELFSIIDKIEPNFDEFMEQNCFNKRITLNPYDVNKLVKY